MKRIGRQVTFAMATATALMACSEAPLESQEEGTLALVGFHQSVDRSLLERAEADVLRRLRDAARGPGAGQANPC